MTVSQLITQLQVYNPDHEVITHDSTVIDSSGNDDENCTVLLYLEPAFTEEELKCPKPALSTKPISKPSETL